MSNLPNCIAVRRHAHIMGATDMHACAWQRNFPPRVRTEAGNKSESLRRRGQVLAVGERLREHSPCPVTLLVPGPSVGQTTRPVLHRNRSSPQQAQDTDKMEF